MEISSVIYVSELTDDNFESFTSGGLSLVDVHAPWCNPCRQISPIIDQLSVDYLGKLSVGKMDADKNPITMESLQIRSIPAIILYKNGEIVERSIGMVNKKKMVEMIESHL